MVSVSETRKDDVVCLDESLSETSFSGDEGSLVNSFSFDMKQSDHSGIKATKASTPSLNFL